MQLENHAKEGESPVDAEHPNNLVVYFGGLHPPSLNILF